MSVKNFVAALALSAAASFAWLGLSAAPAAAAPTTQLKLIGQELGLHAKKHHKKKHHHKKVANASSVQGVQNSSGTAASKTGKKHHKKHKKHKKA